MWLLLDELISSDNYWELNKNSTVKEFEELVCMYERNISKLEDIIRIINCCEKIPEVDQKKVKKQAIDSAALLKDELIKIKNKWETNK